MHLDGIEVFFAVSSAFVPFVHLIFCLFCFASLKAIDGQAFQPKEEGPELEVSFDTAIAPGVPTT